MTCLSESVVSIDTSHSKMCNQQGSTCPLRDVCVKIIQSKKKKRLQNFFHLTQKNIQPFSPKLSGARLWGQLSEQRRPDFPHPGHVLELLREDPKAFPDQPSDRVTPACSGSSLRSPPGGACQEYLPRKASRGHAIQIPEPPQLAPLEKNIFNKKQQHFK